MNVFRSRKKSVSEADGRPSLDREKAPPVPSLRGRTIFRRGGKTQPEVKPEIDLTSALPSSDDFRTSLLLPNLSARFSMLREQDDPTSKIGKASDDSVLFPKRASRLDLFGRGDLGDIAEVSSISDRRRPFATERHHSDASYDHGYGSEDDAPTSATSTGGGIMNRSKPGQGSNVFGGRQRVLMISAQGGRATKAVYHDDVSLSVFQELRLKERQARQESEDAVEDDQGDRSSHEQDRQRKRETNSSTNSVPHEGRTSTAATSIASQWGAKASPVGTPGERPGERPGQKRRLYGQGLEQQLQEQQSSAASRLNSLQRNVQRNGSVPTTRSATNLHDRFRSPSPFGSASPSPVIGPGGFGGFGGFDFGPSSRDRSPSHDAAGVRQTPPRSPQSATSPIDPTLVAALEPNDVGKATASGAFNKPRGPYNEQQFAQRQLQLQEGRSTPPARSASRDDAASSTTSPRPRHDSDASAYSAQSVRMPPVAAAAAAATTVSTDSASYTSARAPSQSSNLSSPRAASQASNPPSAYRAPSQASDAARAPAPAAEPRPRPTQINVHSAPLTSFMDPTASTPSPSTLLENPPSAPLEPPAPRTAPPSLPNPTTGPSLGSGLDSLVRGHLRQISGASSVYPDSPGEAPPEFAREAARAESPPPAAAPVLPPAEEAASAEALTAQESMSLRAKQILERANQLANNSQKAYDVLGGPSAHDKVQQVLGAEAPRRSNESTRPWQEQLRGHARGVSTETQKEREEFANELAERRKQVQDNLMRLEEVNSPVDPESGPNKNALGLLRNASRSEPQENAKAAKMLGMGASPPPTRRPPEPQAGRPRTPSQTQRPSGERPSAERPRAGTGERNIGAERRERFFRKGQHPAAQNFERPGMTSAAPLPPGQYGYGRQAAPELTSYVPAGRARKYSPPSVHPPSGPGASSRAVKSSPDRTRSGTASSTSPGSYFPTQSPPRARMPGSPHGPGHQQAFATNTTPPVEHPPPPPTTNPAIAAQNARVMQGRQRARSFGKQDISEPTFVSGTSSMHTVPLPNGAPPMNGTDGRRGEVPPLPAMHPNRRRGGPAPTHNGFAGYGGPVRSEVRTPESAPADQTEFHPRLSPEHSEAERRDRLRKVGSEGKSIAARARHHALMREAETVPEVAAMR